MLEKGRGGERNKQQWRCRLNYSNNDNYSNSSNSYGKNKSISSNRHFDSNYWNNSYSSSSSNNCWGDCSFVLTCHLFRLLERRGLVRPVEAGQGDEAVAAEQEDRVLGAAPSAVAVVAAAGIKTKVRLGSFQKRKVYSLHKCSGLTNNTDIGFFSPDDNTGTKLSAIIQ